MRTTHSAVLAATFLFAACTSGTASLSQETMNPLTASRYGDELADRMADLIIQNDPVVKQPGMEEYIKEQISKGKDMANAAREIQQKNMLGEIVPVKQAVSGFALYADDMAYLSSDFQSDPGSALHVYLTTVVDPRDVTFPDKTALDLGMIRNVYGASSYSVPHQDKPELYRTLVIYETKLKRIYGFAQLSVHQR